MGVKRAKLNVIIKNAALAVFNSHQHLTIKRILKKMWQPYARSKQTEGRKDIQNQAKLNFCHSICLKYLLIFNNNLAFFLVCVVIFVMFK